MFTSALRALVNVACTSVVHISNGPPYYTHITQCMVAIYCLLIAKILPSGYIISTKAEPILIHMHPWVNIWQSTDSTMCYVQRVHVSHKAMHSGSLCPQRLVHINAIIIPSKECRHSNYSLPDAIGDSDGNETRNEPACSTEEEGTMEEEGGSGGSSVALGQHSTAGRSGRNKSTSAFST